MRRVADVGMRDYYVKFVHKSLTKKSAEEKKLATSIKIRDNLYQYLTVRRENIKEEYNIDLSLYREFTQNKHDDTCSLSNKAHKTYRNLDPRKDTTDIVQLIKYANSLIAVDVIQKRLNYYAECAAISFPKFQAIVNKYYMQVHKFVLEGKAYKFAGGVGTFFIERVHVENPKVTIDFRETNKRKKEILDSGYELWDRKKYGTAKALGQEYNGIRYVTHRKLHDFNMFRIINSTHWKNNNYSFGHVDYINNKFKGMTYDEIIALCEDEADLTSLQICLKFKLAMLLRMNPGASLRYIRERATS